MIQPTITTIPAIVTVNVNGMEEVFGTDTSAACTAYAAIYSTDGKLLGSGTANVSQNQGAVSINVNIPSLPANYTVKLFLLYGNSRPLNDYYMHT